MTKKLFGGLWTLGMYAIVAAVTWHLLGASSPRLAAASIVVGGFVLFGSYHLAIAGRLSAVDAAVVAAVLLVLTYGGAIGF